MKRFFLLLGLLPLVGTIGAQISIDCLEGVIISGRDCYFCDPGKSYTFSGLRINYPTGRSLYIRRPYETRYSETAAVIAYDQDNTVSVLLSRTVYAHIDSLKAAIKACDTPLAPDSLQARIDTFLLVGNTIYLSLEGDEEPAWTIDLTNVDCACDCCEEEGCGLAIYRQHFARVTGNRVTVTANGGDLSGPPENIGVFVEGLKQQQGGDYTLSGSDIVFNYPLEGEDVVAWIAVDTAGNNTQYFTRQYFLDITGSTVTPSASFPQDLNGVKVYVEGLEQFAGYDFNFSGNSIEFNYPLQGEDVETWWLDEGKCTLLQVSRQFFPDVTGSTLTVTANGGTMPVLSQAIMVEVEGAFLQEGPTGDYTRSGNTITFNYPLREEDVEIWFVIGTSDVGYLGDFQNE